VADQPLGELDVLVSADWSELQSDFQDIQEAGQAAADAIADAFSDTGTFDAMSDSLSGLSEALSGVGDASESTVDGLSEAGDSADDFSASSFALAQAILEVTEEMNSVGDSASDAAGAVGEIDDASSEAASSISDLDDAASEADDSLSEIADSTEEASDALSGIGDSAEEATDSLSDLSNAGVEVGGQWSLFGGEVQEAAAQLDLFDQSSIDAASSLSQVGDGVESILPSIQNLPPALEEVDDDSEEAEGGLEGMVEQLTLLGEALAITEGLKEFGEEALNAAGTVQSVTIGLTSLTGSAQQADDIIEQIKDLAATEPFAFPEIAPTIQKMVAMGVSAEQVGVTMQAVANSSAATGNAFSGVANMLDRMSLSGTANARSMAALGISTADLGAAMGVTADEAAAAFKALDQEDRITALDTALSKFSGDAIAQAQGISGEWQIFQNNFEEVMVGVGNALAPVVGDILSFGDTVAKAVASAAEAFSGFSGPVQDTIAAVGLLAAAVVPATAALSALGLAVIGLQGIIPAVTGLMSAFNLANNTATAAATAAGGAITTEGAAAATAAPNIAAVGAAATETAVAEDTLAASAAAAAGEAGLGALSVAAIGVKGSLAALAAVMAGWSIGDWLGGLQDASQELNTMSGFAKSLGVNLDQTSASGDGLSNAITKLNTIAQGYGMTLVQGDLSQQEFALALLQSIKSAQSAGEGIEGVGTAAANTDPQVLRLQQSVANLKGALIEAQTTLEIVQDTEQGTAQYSTDLAAAQANVTKAQNALNTEIGKTPAALKAAQAAAQAWDNDANLSGAQIRALSGYFDSFQAKVDEATADITAKMEAQSTAATTAAGVWLTMATNANSSAEEQEVAWTQISQAAQKGGESIGAAITQAAGQMGGFNAILNSSITVLQTLATSGTASANELKDALSNVQTIASTAGVGIGALADQINTAGAAMSGLGVVIENGKLQLVALGSQAQSTGDDVLDFELGINNASAAVVKLGTSGTAVTSSMSQVQDAATGASVGITNLRGAAVAATAATQNFGATASQFTGGPLSLLISQFNAATANATAYAAVLSNGVIYAESSAGVATAGLTGNVSQFSDGVVYATSAAGQATTAITNYAEANGAAVAPTQALTNANDALVDSLDAVAAASGAASRGSGGGGGAGNNAQAALESFAAAAANPFSDLSAMGLGEFDYGGQYGGGGIDVNVSGGEAYQQQLAQQTSSALQAAVQANLQAEQAQSQAILQNAQATQQATQATTAASTATSTLSQLLALLEAGLGTTTTSTQQLEYALTGGSLAPSMDQTTLATSTLDGEMRDLSGDSIPAVTASSGDLASSLNTLTVTTNFLSNSADMASETSADLNTSLASIQAQLQNVNTTGSEYASQLAQLDDEGQGNTATAEALTLALGQENQASLDLQDSTGDVYSAIQAAAYVAAQATPTFASFGNQIIDIATGAIVGSGAMNPLVDSVTDLGTASTATASAVGDSSTSGLTGAVTDLGAAASDSASTVSSASNVTVASVNAAAAALNAGTETMAQFEATVGAYVATLQSAAASVGVAITSIGSLTSASTGAASTAGFSSSQPSGTQLSSDLVQTSSGDWEYSATGANGPGWYYQGAQQATGAVIGPSSSSSTSGPPTSSGFSATEPAGATTVSATVADTSAGQWQQTVGPEGPGWYFQGGGMAVTGGSNYSPSATFGNGTATPASSPITINITGMTPANAQTVAQQMVTALKNAGIGKLT
jgi:chromosome segregation ATPase